jgi:3-deoxy-manno-octulosonate cytidylyltransferase (CMP-KDO synthetase)
MTQSSCVVIPARFASSRYPGKPLVPLLGKPMILWVAEIAAKVVGPNHVYVATEDSRILDTVQQAGFNALMTSKTALTGTDRLYEAAEQIAYDIYVNVQGDEPLVDPDDIATCIALKQRHPELVINGYTWMGQKEDPCSVNVPKVITTENDIMVYMSRLPIPGAKTPDLHPGQFKKQVCIYGFSKPELKAFHEFDRKGALEASEDIEILRFLELERQVKMYECKPGSLAVDVPEDVAAVEEQLRKRTQH